MKNVSPTKSLFFYGLFLIILGVVGFLSNPEKAKTALITGGIFGGLSLLWSYLSQKNHWSLYAALTTTLLIFLATAGRAIVSWKTVLSGQSEKTLAATLIALMSVSSLCVLPILIKAIKQKRAKI